jgi:glucokinase-like ROK family protein
MAAANRELIRAINRFKILHTIRYHGRISRVEIAKATGLSQASVTGITADLIEAGLLIEKEAGESIGGRRPMLLALNPEGAFAVGVYLSINQINVVIVNFEAQIVAAHALPLAKPYYEPESIGDKIAQAVQACMWQANFSREQISGVGIGIPGLVDAQTGLVRFYPNYRWENVHFRDIIYRKIDHPTYIENSANTLTIAEQGFGEGRGLDNFLLITLEHGVGMGVVINGRLYRGDRGVAGEFGHTTVDPDGIECRCGKTGCLETIVGNYGILHRAKSAAQDGLWQIDAPESITIDDVLMSAKNGVGCLDDIYREAGRTLGIGIANLIAVFNPSKIFISGKGTLAGNLLFDTMNAAISRSVSDKISGNTEIVVKSWRQEDYARGAGTLVLQEIYKSPAHRIVPII